MFYENLISQIDQHHNNRHLKMHRGIKMKKKVYRASPAFYKSRNGDRCGMKTSIATIEEIHTTEERG